MFPGDNRELPGIIEPVAQAPFPEGRPVPSFCCRVFMVFRGGGSRKDVLTALIPSVSAGTKEGDRGKRPLSLPGQIRRCPGYFTTLILSAKMILSKVLLSVLLSNFSIGFESGNSTISPLLSLALRAAIQIFCPFSSTSRYV